MSGIAVVASSGVPNGNIKFSPTRGFQVNGHEVACAGSVIATHRVGRKGKHKLSRVRSYSSNFFIGGRPACREGDATSCGHPIERGSANFFIN